MPVPAVLLRAQFALARARGLTDILAAEAKLYGVPVWVADGIASRETGYRNILGDWVSGSGYHGVGLVQVDIQHPIAREARDSGSWKVAPRPLVTYGMHLLADYHQQVRKALPLLTEEAGWKVASSAYNCGVGPAVEGSVKHASSDFHTTGRSYGRDVMERAATFRKIRGL